MVRIIKKSILLSMILLSFSSLNCQTFGLNDIPLFSSEVNYDINLMIDAQKDFPLNEYSVLYADQIVEAENDFLKECSKLESSPYVGVWKLTDQLGNLVGHHSFNFSDTIEISMYKNSIVFDNWGNRSFLYAGNNDRLYIFSRWINIIRQINVIDDKMYVYIVDDNKWVLDPIHENGKYFFTRK